MVEPLIAALNDHEHLVQTAAAIGLGKVKDRRAVEPLIAALKSGSSGAGDEAAEALAEIKDPRAVAPLIDVMQDKDSFSRESAAGALSQFKDPRAVRALLAALRAHDMPVIPPAITFYIRHGVPGSEATLIEVLDDGGYQEMAEEFLNSGNGRLRMAALDWATKNGYVPDNEEPEAGSVTWGSAR